MATWVDETSAVETWVNAGTSQYTDHGFQFGAFQAGAFQISNYNDPLPSDEVWTDL